MRVLILLKTADGGRWAVPPAVALAARGHDVIFGLPSLCGTLPNLVRENGLQVVVAEAPAVGAGLAAQPGSVFRLRRQIRDLATDVVVSHLYASALAGRMALAVGDIPHVYVSAGPLYLENVFIRIAERALCRLDAHIICSSVYLLQQYRRLGVPTENLSVIPYGWPPEWAEETALPSRAVARAALHIDETEFLVVCVALFYAPKRLVHRGRGIKGHDVLLEGWRRFTAAGGRGTLLLVGGGFGPGGDGHRKELMARFADLPSVRWIDTVKDVRPYYRAADVSVSPSLSENLGAPAEASKLGTPSVASRVGGLPEIVVDRWNGWLVPPGDPGSIALALAEANDLGPTWRTRFGERACLRANELCDQRRNGEAFADLIESVVVGGSLHQRTGK